MSVARALADPRVRLGAGTAALLVTAMAARRNRVSPGEAAAFRAVNDLPGWLYPPAWVVMQLGTLGAAPAAAGAAWLAGDRQLAGRLLAGGTSAWTLSKVVKRMVQRPRPASLLPGTRRRGREAAGLGYLSGHAGVAVVLGAAVLPRLGPGGRAVTLAAVPVVGLTRIYVGAHLPLDVAGGAALGLAIDAAMNLRRDRAGCETDDYDERTRSGWSVLVNGRAHAIYEEAEIHRLSRLGLRPWVSTADRPFWIRIRPTSISGRRIPDPEAGFGRLTR